MCSSTRVSIGVNSHTHTRRVIAYTHMHRCIQCLCFRECAQTHASNNHLHVLWLKIERFSNQFSCAYICHSSYEYCISLSLCLFPCAHSRYRHAHPRPYQSRTHIDRPVQISMRQTHRREPTREIGCCVNTHMNHTEISRVQHSLVANKHKNPHKQIQTNAPTNCASTRIVLCEPLRPSLLARSNSHVCAHTRCQYAYPCPYQSLTHIDTYRHGDRIQIGVTHQATHAPTHCLPSSHACTCMHMRHAHARVHRGLCIYIHTYT
jgi:hypothetical protein